MAKPDNRPTPKPEATVPANDPVPAPVAEPAPAPKPARTALETYLAMHYPGYALVEAKDGKAVLECAGRKHTITIPAL